MNAREHHAEAEHLLAEAKHARDEAHQRILLTAAQVHATLATAPTYAKAGVMADRVDAKAGGQS